MSKKKKIILLARSNAYTTPKSETWDMKNTKDYNRKAIKRNDKKEFD